MGLSRPQKNLDTEICRFLDEQKAENIVVIDLKEKSSIADSIIIASGLSQRHITALGEKLKEHLHKLGVHSIQIEGLPNSDWILVDAGDVIIHLFKPEVREFYNIEKIWGADFRFETRAML
jgi:ribosome-associated protein